MSSHWVFQATLLALGSYRKKQKLRSRKWQALFKNMCNSYLCQSIFIYFQCLPLQLSLLDKIHYLSFSHVHYLAYRAREKNKEENKLDISSFVFFKSLTTSFRIYNDLLESIRWLNMIKHGWLSMDSFIIGTHLIKNRCQWTIVNKFFWKPCNLRYLSQPQ